MPPGEIEYLGLCLDQLDKHCEVHVRHADSAEQRHEASLAVEPPWAVWSAASFRHPALRALDTPPASAVVSILFVAPLLLGRSRDCPSFQCVKRLVLNRRRQVAVPCRECNPSQRQPGRDGSGQSAYSRLSATRKHHASKFTASRM